ncbi:hypothetical protein IWQ60_009003, partial [Tieghemiomyces parasiticus]
VSAGTPLSTNLHPDRLCKVAWGILLSRYTGAEHVAFGHVQAPSPPLDPKLPASSLTVCGLRLDPGVKLASALGHPTSSSDHPLHHQEWPVQASHQGQLNTVLVSYANLLSIQSRERSPSDLDTNNQSTVSVEQASLTILATMTRAILVLSWQVATGSLEVRLAFDRTQVAEAAVQELGRQFSIVVRALAEVMLHPKQLAHLTIADVAWIDELERQRLLQFAGTISHPDAVNTPVHLLVGEWASRTPDGIALDHEGRTVTYTEFDRMTSALAQMLTRDHGVRPEVRIALLLPKSIDFFIALFAVLKSGAAYVPIDPEYPEERVRYIIEDSQATLVLASSVTQGRLGSIACPKLLVSNVAEALPSTKDNDCPFIPHHSGPKDLAYIVYTSGTTGQPKGVMVEHGSLVSLTVDPIVDRYYGSGQRDLLVMSVCFDGMLWPTMKTLSRGGTLVLPGPDLLSDLSSVHTASVTPSFLAKLHPEQFPLLRGIFCGGEPCSQRLVSTWSPHCSVNNGYGPTETTVISFATALHVDDIITVGRPLRNVLAYIVDDDLHMVPVGAPGQLLIGGLGVARGYCNRPDFTAQRFIANPFGPGRVFQTGDRARWLTNGQVDILGRMDHQVKLRGFRIELEEIEAVASSFPAVQLAVASVQNNCLALFVEPQSVDTVAMLNHLRSRLAKFMIPDHIISVASLPLTANGKVNRKALPDVPTPLSNPSHTVPQGFTTLELHLREAWAQILQLPGDQIGTADDFFRIGGDSISAILLVSKCRQLGYKATVPLIYECRQLHTLAARLTPLATAASEENQHQVQGCVDLTPIQRWFYGLPFRNPHHFNQSFTLRVDPSVTLGQISHALVQLANHHDILRARFHLNDEGTWMQNIPTTEVIPSQIPVTEATVNEVDYADFNLKVQSSLHLTDGPVMAACLIHTGAESEPARLFWTIHHALVDLVSWRVLIEDLQTLLAGGQLPPKTLSFQTWCSQLDNYARALTADAWPVQSMTVDNRQLLPPPEVLDPVPTAARLSISYEFDREFTTRLLLQLAPQWRVTPRDILLATFARAYCQALGTTQVSFVMEGHGREPWSGAMDVSRTVGWFTVLYPLVLDVPLGSSILATLHHTKEAMQQIPVRGFPYSLLHHMPGADPTERAKLLAKTPEHFDVQFNYFGRFGNAEAGGSDSGAVSIEWDDRFGLHDFAPDEHVIFDINPMPLVNQDRLRLVMEYNPRVYGTQWAEQLINLWRQDLEHLAATPTASVQPLLTRFDAPLLQPTAQEFDTLLADMEERGIAASDVADILPCTPIQGGLLVATLQDPSAYLVQVAITLSGEVVLSRLQQALAALTQRHSVLRTVFIPTVAPRGNGLAQVVLHCSPLAWSLAEAPLPSLTDFFNANRALGFDMTRPMVRVDVFPTERSNEYLLVLAIHHALVDGWSIPLLLRDLGQLYASPDMPGQLTSPSFNTVVEQVANQDQDDARAFWVEYLRGVQPTPAPMLSTELTGEHGFAEYHCTLDVDKSRLHDAAQQFGVTLSTLLKAAYALVLAQYLDRDDLVIGFVVSGRNLDVADIANVVGPCLNTVPLRFRLMDQPIGQWLQQLQADATGMIPFEHTSLAKVKAWCSPIPASPLFHVLGGFENFPQGSHQAGDMNLELVRVHEFTEYPLTLDFVDGPHAVGVKCFYGRMFFSEANIVQLVQQVSSVLVKLTKATADTTITQVSHSLPDLAQNCLGRLITADGIQLPLAILDHYLAKQGLPTPYSVSIHGGRIVTRISAPEAACESFRPLLASVNLPADLVPAAFISLEAYPHLSGASEGDVARLGEAYLRVSDTESQRSSLDTVGRWLAVTCTDLLLGTGDGMPDGENIWVSVLARPTLFLQLEHRISQRFGATLDSQNVLACDDLAALTLVIQRSSPSLSPIRTPEGQSNKSKYELIRLMKATPYQAQVWLACQLSEDPGQFYHQAKLSIPRQLTHSDVQWVLDQFLSQVDWLRTVVRKEEGQLVACLLSPKRLSSATQATVGSQSLRRDGLEAAGKVLVSTDMLAVLYQPEPPRLVVRMHQILAPEMLFHLLTEELQLAFRAKHDGQAFNVSPSLAMGHTTTVGRPPSDSSVRTYWTETMAEASADLKLPLDRPRTRVPTFSSAYLRFGLAQEVIRGLSCPTEGNPVAPLGLWTALVGSYLGRICGTDDVLVDMLLNYGVHRGNPCAVFLGHLACPLRVLGAASAPSLSDLSTILSQQLQRSVNHLTSDYDLYAGLPRPLAHPLWHPVRVGVAVDPVEWDAETQSHLALWHDIIFRISLSGPSPGMTLQYNPDLFDSATVERLGANLLYFSQVALTSTPPLTTVPLVCPTEEKILLEEFGQSPSEYDPSDTSTSVISLIRDSVQRSPHTVALESQLETVNYTEMDAQVNSLTRALQHRGIGVQDRVAVIVESRPATVMAMLALWLLRAVYVPVDSTLPQHRQRYMIETAQCTVVLNMTATEVIWPDALPGLELLKTAMVSGSTLPPYGHHPEDLAYILFTSGTTGQPKGVTIRHASLTNLLLAPETTLCPEPGTRYLQTMAVGFDVFILVALSPLCTSSTLVFSNGDTPAALQGVDGVFLTPSVLGSLSPTIYPNLRRVMSAGEALPTELAAKWLPYCEVQNLYGPTEITIISHTLTAQLDKPIAIGRPIAGSECYIVNQHDQLVPIGSVGEICVGGLGVSAGYVNRPDLNEEKFVRLPYSSGPVYRTGDLGRWLPTGEVECLGRRDDQVKLRGFRIELAEVRGALLNLPSVQDAHVLIHERSLVAFVNSNPFDAVEITSALREVLPTYMVPTHVLGLDHIPLTTNGKADQRALLVQFASYQQRTQDQLNLVDFPATHSSEARALIQAVSDVLHLEIAAVNSSLTFLKLGGDSISAIQVSTRCRQLGYSLPVPVILLGKALVELSALMRPIEPKGEITLQTVDPVVVWSPDHFSLLHCTAADLNKIAADLPALHLTQADVADLYPMSLTQQGLWAATVRDPAEYVVQFALTVCGNITADQVHQALASVVARHAILRTIFLTTFSNAYCNGVQVVTKEPRFGWTTVDDWVEIHVETETEYIASNWRRGFVAGDPLLRALVKREAKGSYRLIMTAHHALMDGWSMGVLLDELRRTLGGNSSLTAAAPPQLRDYVKWTQLQDDGHAREYWRTYLHGIKQPSLLSLPRDPSAIRTKREHRFRLYAGLNELKKLSQLHGLTLYTLLKAAWALLLYRYTGQEDVVFGSVVSGRALPLADIERLIGCLVNTVPCRVHIDPELHVVAHLRRLNDEGRLGIPHEYNHLTKIDKWVPSDVSVSDLFNTLLVYENVPDWGSERVDETVKFSDLTIVRSAEYAMTVIAQPEDGHIFGYLNWDLATFAAPYVEALGQHLQKVFAKLVDCLREGDRGVATLSSLQLLSPSELQAVTDVLARPTAAVNCDVCVHDLVAQQVRRTPDTNAVEYDDPDTGLIGWTYQELFDRATQVAGYLLSQAVHREEPVGLLIRRHPTLVVGMVAILQAGGAFVPLDADLPLDRLRLIVEDCGMRHILSNVTDAALVTSIGELPGVQIHDIGAIMYSSPTDQAPVPLPQVSPANLSHVIYTSGTTGRPKGVPIEHRTVASYLQQSEKVHGVAPGARFMQNMALGFDCLILEVLTTLAQGGTLVVRTELLDTLPRVEAVMITPSVLAMLDPGKYPNLQQIITAGEALPTLLAQRWARHCRVLNLYGPAEAFATHSIQLGPDDQVTVGNPIPNTECYVLDAELRPVPFGVMGEICFGGPCVTRGYLNRPELNRTQFVPNPFTGKGRLYRSGDLGRWLLDGTVEYIARKDDQVKVRGYRVELTEVEAIILQTPEVESAAAVLLDGKLYAFVTPQGVPVCQVKAFTTARLPAYMVPTVTFALDQLPLSHNGKVDRRHLKKLVPALLVRDEGSTTQGPRNNAERQVVAAMAQTLNLSAGKIDIHDSFFQMGGDSISAIRLSSLCRDYGIYVTMAQIFQYGTPAALAGIIDFDSSPSTTMAYRPFELVASTEVAIEDLAAEIATNMGVGTETIEDILPVSSLQQGFLVSTLKDPRAYMVQTVYDLTGPLDVAKLHQSWSQVVRSHQILRTKFLVPTDQSQNAFLQVVLRDTDFEWTYHDQPLAGLDQVEHHHLVADRARGFTLTGPLLRFAVYRGPADRHLFCTTFHHALLDAWSESIVMAESLEYYHGVKAQPRPQYHEFIRNLTHIDQEGMAAFWRDNLDGVKLHPAIQFPRESNAMPTEHGEIRHPVSTSLLAIKQFCRGMGLTVNSLLRAVWALTLARYLGENEEVTLGVLVSGRNLPVPGIEGMVGMCINTLPLRVRVDRNHTITDFLRQVNADSGTLTAYEQCSLVDIKRWAELDADSDLFTSLLVYDNYETTTSARTDQINYVPRSGQNFTEYAYTANFYDQDDTLMLNLSYLTRYCNPSYAHYLVHFIDHCLTAIVSGLTEQLGNILTLPAAEQVLIRQWSDGTTIDFPQKDWLAHQFFTQHLATRADAIALESATDQFTYAEVHHRACAIAAALHSQGARCGDRVALLFTRCPEFIFSYLAVLLLGGVCVPMDANNAPDRLLYMVDLLDDPWGVTHSATGELAAELGFTDDRLIYADRVLTKASQVQVLDPTPEHTLDSLAYIIFTSGTTGQPKGVQVTHRSLANFILAYSERFQILPDCRFLLISNFSFDVHLLEIFGTFHAGGTLVFQDGQILDDLHRITACFLVPSLLAALEPTDYYNITHLLVGGEAFQASAAAKWFGRARLYNAYGPTEATILSHGRLMRPGDNITIGTTMANMQCHVLDDQLRPVPIGRPGEICIGGAGVAEGYWKRSDLTNQAFVGNPFGTGRLYRTGDVGCWLTDGEVQVLGRKDFQVKLRGFRIELGEIESTCQAFPGLANAVALVKDKCLVVYISPTDVKVEALKEHIAAKLPHYMVPSVIVSMIVLPLTSIGKVDRRALQALPLPQEPDLDGSDDLPVSKTFSTLRRALIETLNVDPARVVPSASFLRLGGDSISAILFSSQCKNYGLKLTVADILKHPMLTRLEQCAEPILDVCEPKPQMDPSGPLSPTAVMRQVIPSMRYVNHFNQSSLLSCRSPPTLAAFKEAIRALVVHHDILRLHLTDMDGKSSMAVLPLPEDTSTDAFLARFASVTEESLLLDDYDDWVLRTQQSISVEHGPVLACSLLTVDAQPYVYLTVHHLCIDFVSWRIMLEDLETLLQGQMLQPKTLPFREWAMLVNDYAPTLADDLWPDHGPVSTLPIDILPVPVTYRTVQSVGRNLGLELSQILYEQAAPRVDASPQEFMVASLVMALTTTFQLDSLEVQMEGHGRQPWRSDLDVSRTLGWFTAIYPVAFHPDQSEHYASLPQALRLLAHVKQRLHSIPDSGFPYGLLKYLKGRNPSQLTRDNSLTQPTGVVFNYVDRSDQLYSSDGFWSPSSLGSRWSHALSLDEVVQYASSASCDYDGKHGLTLNLEYSTVMYHERTANTITNHWLDNLQQLIQAALASPLPCHTASDFGLPSLSKPVFGRLVQITLPNLGLPVDEVDDLYPCLPIQEGLLLATLKDPAAYLVQSIYDIQGPLDTVRLQNAWIETAQQHPILRTQFLLGLPDTPFTNMQLVRKHADARWLVADWSDLDPALAQAEYIRLEREQGFDLKQIPIRFGLFHLAPEHHRLVISIHHAILDGWSGGLFTNALLLNYAGRVVPPAGQVKELVAYIQAGDTTKAEQFWAAQLDGIEMPSLLVDPYCVPDLTVKPSDAAYYGSLARTLEIGDQVINFTQSYGVAVSTFFRAAVALVLHRHTGSEHPVFGTVVSGRNVAVAQVESTIGPCISTIPCRARIGRALTVGDFLQTLHHDDTAAYDFEHCRLTDIHRWSGMSPEQPLFNVLLAYQNYPEVQSDTDLPIRLSLLDSHDPTDVPLTLIVAHQDTQLYVKAGFQSGVFSTDYVERFVDHLETTIRSLVTTSPSDLVASLSMLSESEHELLTNDWARNPINLPTDSYAHEGFLSCVHSGPGRVAIRDGEQEYTYGQLHLMATHLAHRLHQTGKGGPDQVIGILAGNSVELIVGQLAVWMTGSAFVVIAPDYPVERQQFILADAACVAVAGPPALLATFKADTPTPQLAIDLSRLHSDHAVGRMSQAEIDGGNLAYVIYTSGTTGTPKGVMHEHGAAANHLQGFIRTTGMTADVVTPTLLTPTFDVSVSEIWTTLSVGGLLLITQGDQKRALQQATRAACTPSLVSPFEPSDFPGLYSLVLAGEPSSQALVDKWSTSLRLFNWYGPTEVANGSHGVELKPGATVTIGRPFPNAVGLILDEHLRPSPVGIIGQLYLGGKGLARGYLNRPELTAEKFITWPLTGERLYQSGDLARWLPDGQVECLGRIDHQVKVRGFRVELGEVEAVLESHPTVTQACVLVQDTHLVGYVCPALPGDNETVLDWLRNCLPHYMVPSALVGLAELPRTPVGKVDRKALPPFHFNRSPTDTDLPTLSPVESQLMQTVADCLRLDASVIRLNSTFYQIGGNSLSAIQVVAQCQRNGLHLAIADLNRNNTLRQVARLCVAVNITATTRTRADQKVMSCPHLTPGQLAFFSMPLTKPNAFTLPVMFKSGRTFPEWQWGTAVRCMVELHPMLRGLFRQDEQTGTMTYDVGDRPLHDYYRFELHHVKDFATAMSMLPSLCLKLDIESGPLSTFHVFDLGHEQYFFHCVHHLASDYLSYKVFAEDLTRLLLDQQVEPPTVSCQAWAEYLHQVTQDLDLDTLTVPPPLPDLAVRLRGEVVTLESTPGGRHPECLVCLDISASTLTSAANRFGATPIELLVTALHMAYQEVFHFSVMGLAFLTHGRRPVGDTAFDLSRTVGFFAHYVPVVLDAPRAAGFRTTLRHTQETLGTGIEDGMKLALVRYLRDFTDPTQRRPYEIDPPFGFSYLAPTQASVPSDGSQPLLQEKLNITAELRDLTTLELTRPFELTVTHEGNRLDLLVIGQRNQGIPPMIQRLLSVWSETLRLMVATPDLM